MRCIMCAAIRLQPDAHTRTSHVTITCLPLSNAGRPASLLLLVNPCGCCN
jgi:hypothetical protein